MFPEYEERRHLTQTLPNTFAIRSQGIWDADIKAIFGQIEQLGYETKDWRALAFNRNPPQWFELVADLPVWMQFVAISVGIAASGFITEIGKAAASDLWKNKRELSAAARKEIGNQGIRGATTTLLAEA